MPGLPVLNRSRRDERYGPSRRMRTCLGTWFSMGTGRAAEDALPAELRFELPGQQILKLVGLDGEEVGPTAAKPFGPVGHHLRRGPPGQVGLDV